MGGDSKAKSEEGAEEEARAIHRWIAFSELLVPRRLRRERGMPRAGEEAGLKGGEGEGDPEPDPAEGP